MFHCPARACAAVRHFALSCWAIACLLSSPQAVAVEGGLGGCCSRILFWEDLTSSFRGTSKPAEDEQKAKRIETDRHDFTQSPKTVPKGKLQWEFGYTYFYSDRDGEIESAHTTPESLLRFGLTDHIELRLRTNYAWEFGEAEDRSGSEDLRLSLKLGMTAEQQFVPESALELRFTASTGGTDFSTEQIDFGLDYIYGWRLTESIEVDGSTGLLLNGLGEFSLVAEIPAEDDFRAWSQSFAAGIELSPVVTFYSEFFAIFTAGRGDDLSLVFYNVGVDYYVSDKFVLDLRAGVGLSEEAEDFFMGVGGGLQL